MTTIQIPSLIGERVRLNGLSALPETMLDELADEACKQHWAEHNGGQRPDSKLSVLHVLGASARQKLVELLVSPPIANLPVRNLQLVGSGQNASEVLMLASAFPGAAVTVVEPHHGDFLRERINQLQQTYPCLETLNRRICFVDKPIEEHKPTELADLTFMSAVLQDQYIIPRIKDGQRVLDALSASTRPDGLIVTTFIFPAYKPYMEVIGLETQRCVNQYYLYRNGQQKVGEAAYLSVPQDVTEFFDSTSGQESPRNRSSYEFGRWSVEREMNYALPTYLSVKGVGALPASTTEVLVRRGEDLVLLGPVGTPLWQLTLQPDGRMSVLLTQKLVDHIISDETSTGTPITPELLRGLFDYKWGFWQELRTLLKSCPDPSSLTPDKIWGTQIARFDIC